MKKSFTLIEILVVSTIIALLAAAASLSYSQLSKQSRDAKRKTDIEQVRAALEMYRSNEDAYPVGSNWGTTLNVLSSPTIYIQSLPSDPKNPTFTYYYTSSDGTDYTLATHLETDTVTCQSLATQCVSNCTYCAGPYGEK
ncbi:MAG: general secretion pathway protein G [Candidatus Roizmanbacteria bacterium GW2011_GWA2_35_19]|uniref:General secretion pathway protein G n=2 Tax=Candidatus Roizmaniibacteriota TaxID=1752723 RepID=A0A0G0BSG6_9BACT|nr:MAG: general secretion pathway protein G [Candidatus Roizmanbacteria bacterium GW2011_GWC2_35_12]KKP72338.1 MAG: general secretion pathway protein G [Candidatus Roizmanbacteria bacterium GW2011_GWA2_35_19]